MYQELFNYMSNEHGVILLESDMTEIVRLIEKEGSNDARKLLLNTLAKELEFICTEHYKMGGLRYYGANWEEIKSILEKYGYKHEVKF